MSKIIPRETIDVLRNFVDVSLDAYGIDCDLYVPNNLDNLEVKDVYVTPADVIWDHYAALVFIEWNPNIHKLKALGIFVEDEIPLIVCLPNKCINDSGEEVIVDILKQSYIKVPLEYVPSNLQKYTEFELVDQIIHKIHDAVLVQRWKAVPRRVPVVDNRYVIGS